MRREAMIAVGVDTHKDTHVVSALDQLGQLLGELTIEASAVGYGELVAWTRALGEDVVIGVEGAGSYGAGLCEHLKHKGLRVFEVERPRRRERRAGKSDRIDALAAAKRVLAGEGLSTPRAGGIRRGLGALLAVQRACVGERTRLLNQLQALCVTAPPALRERIGRGGGEQLQRRIARMRARPAADAEERVVFELDATLLDEPGVGPISAAKLLVADPARFKHEAAFARCNGTAPLPASSGKTIRHRLNRGGDRQLNNAIHTIALSRSLHHPETQAYLKRRMTEGKTKREAMRSLKRHLSRRLYKRLITVPLTP